MGTRSSSMGSLLPFPAATFDSLRSIGTAVAGPCVAVRTLQPESAPGPLLVGLQSPNGCSHLLLAARGLTVRGARAGWSGAACVLSRGLAPEFFTEGSGGSYASERQRAELDQPHPLVSAEVTD